MNVNLASKVKKSVLGELSMILTVEKSGYLDLVNFLMFLKLNKFSFFPLLLVPLSVSSSINLPSLTSMKLSK